MWSFILFLCGLIVNAVGEFTTVFDGAWDFTHENRVFRAYICSVNSKSIYLSITEMWTNEEDIIHEYTIGVCHFDQLSESDSKFVLASSDAYVLASRTDRNKNGYFSSIVVLRYEKSEDTTYIHFKLTKETRPGSIKLIKGEDPDHFKRDQCWIAPSDGVQNTAYPQVWTAPKQDEQLVIIRKKAKSGCWGLFDSDGTLQKGNGGYLSTIQLQYNEQLMLTKWFDVGDDYKAPACKTGSGMFMIIQESVALLSWQCNDGKSGYQYRMQLSTDVKDDPNYQCPLLTSSKTDL
eukprot:667236_1